MLEEVIPLSPIHFFALQFDCQYLPKNKKKSLDDKKYELPQMDELFGLEKEFAVFSLGWNEEGIYCKVVVQAPLQRSSFPDLQKGDSLEIFLDTRDVKSSGYNTRFCHHFYFLPLPVELNEEPISQNGEITHFRGEEAHPLCDSSLLICEVIEKKQSYQMNLFIPRDCIHGFDPMQFNRLGFNYRINRFKGRPQCFSSTSDEFPIEQQPSLWASLLLIK